MKEKNGQTDNADLHFNRARVLEYLLEVEPALKEYQRSHELDPTLGGDKEKERLVESIHTCQKALLYKVTWLY